MSRIMSVSIQPADSTNVDSLAAALIADWQQGKRTFCLKIDDRFHLEIKDETSFQILLDLLARLENIAAIQKGLNDIEAGRTISLDEYKRKVVAKNGISD
jgi:hypothetical protein